MKIVINPQYKHLESFIKSIPDIFETQGEFVYKKRNVLKIYHVDGYDIIVKSFKKPHLLNRFVYTFFRPSKAKRSYEFALEFLKRGINTPEPIAYIETKENGLLSSSYYLSVFEKGVSEIREEMLGTRGDVHFLKELAGFIAEIQNKGILQKDLSPGNILYKVENGKIFFTLVDINRAEFMTDIPQKQRYKNFERICEKREIIDFLAEEYAKVLSLDENESKREIHKYISKYSKNYHIVNKNE